MTDVEDILRLCSGWTTVRELEEALGVPPGHRAHTKVRNMCKYHSEAGRLERRWTERGTEYRAVPDPKPSMARSPVARAVYEALGGPPSTAAQVAERTGMTPKNALCALHRLAGKGMAERVGEVPGSKASLWARKPLTQTTSEEDGRMDERKEQPKTSKEAEDCEKDTRNEP